MSSTRTRRALVLSALTLALGGGACGSDSSSSTSSSANAGSAPALTKKQYGARAQKVSKQFFTDVQAAQAKVASATDQSGRVAALGGFKQAFTTFADRIEKLDPPQALKAVQGRLVAKIRASAGDIDEVSAAVRAKSAARAQAAQKALQNDVGGVRDAAQKLDAGTK